MKVYEKIVIDIATGQTLAEESFEYQGPVAMCGGGGGAVQEYPPHMLNFHTSILWRNNYDEFETSWVREFNAIYTESPYADTDKLPKDPTALMGYMTALGSEWTSSTEGIGFYKANYLLSYADTDLPDAILAKYKDAALDYVNDKIESETLPRFQAGMRDINAVQSSAFVIGQSNIEGKALMAINTGADAEIYKEYLHMVERSIERYMEYMKQKYTLGVETARIKYVMEDSYRTRIVDQAAMHERWSLELLLTGGNVLASIGSASVQTHQGSTNKAGQALGGALSGAAVGAMWGGGSTLNPVGAGVGAAIGAAVGLLS